MWQSNSTFPGFTTTWQELLEDETINAICIGTWPYMHRALTLAALEKGKHVLTEARMANTAQEARDMLAASRSRPHLVCQLTPTSTTYKIDRVLQRLIGEGFLGELLSVEVQALQNRFVDLGWRIALAPRLGAQWVQHPEYRRRL